MMALGGGAAYIALNKKRMQNYGVKYGEDVEVALQLDDSKYGFNIPEEFEALLEQDDKGAQLFEEPKAKNAISFIIVSGEKQSA